MQSSNNPMNLITPWTGGNARLGTGPLKATKGFSGCQHQAGLGFLTNWCVIPAPGRPWSTDPRRGSQQHPQPWAGPSQGSRHPWPGAGGQRAPKPPKGQD